MAASKEKPATRLAISALCLLGVFGGAVALAMFGDAQEFICVTANYCFTPSEQPFVFGLYAIGVVLSMVLAVILGFALVGLTLRKGIFLGLIAGIFLVIGLVTLGLAWLGEPQDGDSELLHAAFFSTLGVGLLTIGVFAARAQLHRSARGDEASQADQS